MLYLQIASPKSSVLNFLDSNSFEVIISIFQRTEKVPDMERLRYFGHYHRDCQPDERHTLVYYAILPLEQKESAAAGCGNYSVEEAKL